MRAVISDIHGNLEAFEAVLSDIRSQGIKEIYCLGDVIGYGPNPRECIDLVMKNCQVTILGNTIRRPCLIRKASTPPRSGRFSGPAYAGIRRWE